MEVLKKTIFFLKSVDKPARQVRGALGQLRHREAAHVKMNPSHFPLNELPKRRDAAGVADSHVVDCLYMRSQTHEGRHESFGPGNECVAGKGKALLGRILPATDEFLGRNSRALGKGDQPKRDGLIAKLRERGSNVLGIRFPITLQENTIQEPHSPTDSGHELYDIFHEPLHVPQPPVVIPKRHESRDIGHLLMVGNDECIFAARDGVARDSKFDPMKPFGTDHAHAPPGAGTTPVNGSKSSPGKRTNRETERLHEIGEHQRGKQDHAINHSTDCAFHVGQGIKVGQSGKERPILVSGRLPLEFEGRLIRTDFAVRTERFIPAPLY